MRSINIRIIVTFLFYFLTADFNSASEKKTNQKTTSPKVIIISIDGFIGSYFDSPEILSLIPNLKKFSERSAFSHHLRTVNPSITYPAHTSMMTGEDPGIHGIFNNTILDPFEKNEGGWTWYAEDIRVPTLWDLARKKRKRVGNVFWPVTVGAEIELNLPQYWRKKIPEDDKLLRAISTKGLHALAEKKVGTSLNDISEDHIKFETAAWLFETYRPDLLLVYTTDLDTIHHGYGPFSEKAKEKLKDIDSYFGSFLTQLRVYERSDIAVILVSDHGFYSAKFTCAPNVYLLQKGYIQPESQEFDFIFKSSGGSAILLPGKRIPTASELNRIRSDISAECPGVIWREDREDLAVKQQHPEAVAWIFTPEKIYFSGTRKGEIFSEQKSFLHGHGYDNRLPEMETIGGVYWKGIRDKQAWKMNSVKDVFARARLLLGLQEKKPIQK